MNMYDLLLAKKLGGGGGGEATLINKNINANGTYNASSDNADGYSKVVVSVANSYSAGDEGKVVKNGALASQTSATYTSNDTYDTTDISSVTVNVSGGGSSVTSGTYTPAENILKPTINVGASFTNFLIWTNSTVTGKSVKAFKGSYVQFETNNGDVRLLVTTNNGGTAYSSFEGSTAGGNYFFVKNGTDMEVNYNTASGNYPGNFISGLTYNWVAW